MELINTEGVTYKRRGSLRADFDYEGAERNRKAWRQNNRIVLTKKSDRQEK